MNVGLIGFGMVAERFHAPLIAVEPSLCLTHVVERRRRRAQELYPEVTTLTDAEQLWTAPVDIVAVLTPNESHYPLAKAALEAGKHVVVDKPFTNTSAQADELIALAEAKGLVLTAFQNRRWDSDFLTVQALLEHGRLGKVRRFESRWERFRPQLKGGWREGDGEGTGIFYDLGSHMIDQLFTLFGTPRRLRCSLASRREGTNAVDDFDWLADYGDFEALIHSDCLTEPTFRFLVEGDRATYRKTGFDIQEDALARGEIPEGPDWGVEPDEQRGQLYRVEGEAGDIIPTLPGRYPDFYANLSATIQGSARLEVKPRQARDVIRAIELGMESARTGDWVAWS